jgi:hypothetical protein
MAESIRRSYSEFVGVVADVLDRLNIDYGIAGSFASSQYGEPRQTLDVDLTLHLQPVDADRFAAAFEAVQMTADAYAIRETHGYTNPLPFAVIDYANGWKADCYFWRKTAYNQAAFARRSTKHLRDITAMLANMGRWDKTLDVQYLTHWAASLQALEYWNKLWNDFHRSLERCQQ